MKKSFCITAMLLLTSFVKAQPFNQETTSGNIQYVIGKFNKEKLQSGSYASWFQPNFDAYEPQPETIEKLKNQLPEYTITLFMGTWCGDSQREVPRFYKLLEACEFPMERLNAVALHLGKKQMKQSPGGEEEGLDIHRVPTFIVYKESKEVGRIVEEPKESIEKDILQILEGGYQENYYGVTLAQKAMKEMGWEKFGKNRKKLMRSLSPYLKHYMELHTYSRVLYAAGKKQEAHEILKLNQELFPSEPNVYFNVGVFLWNTYQEEKAEEAFSKALEIEKSSAHKEEDLTKKIAFVKENRE